MAADFACISQVLKDALLQDLGDEVVLIFRYGSQLKGTTHVNRQRLFRPGHLLCAGP